MLLWRSVSQHASLFLIHSSPEDANAELQQGLRVMSETAHTAYWACVSGNNETDCTVFHLISARPAASRNGSYLTEINNPGILTHY